MTERAIERPEGAAGTDPGPSVAELDWVEVERLVIDDAYQRPITAKGWRRIRAIAAAFDWTRFTPLVVSLRAGERYAVIDGQHRVHAAALCGVRRVPALVHVMAPAAEARAFAAINGDVLAVSGFALYKAALAAGEAWARDCRRAVAEAGCELMVEDRPRKRRRAGEVYAIALIREHVAARRAADVTRALTALRRGAGEVPLVYEAAILRPWIALSVERPDLSVEWLADFVGRFPLQRILAAADRARAEPRFAGHTRTSMMMQCLRLRLADVGAEAAA